MTDKVIIRQRDFSGGEIVEHGKRRDDVEIVRAGARQMRNWRIRNSGAAEQRPGKRLLFKTDGKRVDEVRFGSLGTFYFEWTPGTLKIRDTTFAIVAAVAGLPWTNANMASIVFDRAGYDIVICFPGMRPKIARWSPPTTSSWTFLDFSFRITAGGQRRTPFYRMAGTLGITLTPSATTGSVTVTASAAVFTAAHVGARIRYIGRQLTITAYTSATQVTATVNETLNGSVSLGIGSSTGFSVGDVVVGGVSGARGEVALINTGTNIYVTYFLGSASFRINEFVIGPGANSEISAVVTITPRASVVWDEEVMNDYRGWPNSVFADRTRIGFCDIPGVPSGVAWSAINGYDDFNVGTLASDGIFETAPANARVYHVAGGADEFVFTDAGVFYIPISESNPLAPGSIAFREITTDAAASVRPIKTAEGVAYVNEGQSRIAAVVATGQASQPWYSRDTSEWHSHLFSGTFSLASINGNSDLAERYVFGANSDGSLAVGRANTGKQWVGWVPWDSSGDVAWVSGSGSNLIATVTYTIGGVPVAFCEMLDVDAYLDAQVAVNSVPTALAAGTDADILLFYGSGTIIGDMTAGGGLAATSDGITTQGSTDAAWHSPTVTSAYAGKTLVQGTRIKKAIAYPAPDNGFTNQTNITVQLYAKQGAAPANATDGTLLATSGSMADTLSPVTLNSSDTATAFDHVWIRLAASSGDIYLAEAQFFTPGSSRQTSGGGTGDLWFMASGMVDVMDGLRYLGTRAVSATGTLTPVEGESFAGAGMVAGLFWTAAVIEPFIPHSGEGRDAGQTMSNREVAKVAVAYQNSTGFLFRKHGDTDGTRVPPFNTGENQDGQPTAREGVRDNFSLIGSAHDPRFEIVKDTPGPARILEISTKVNP